jgi:hypothetical protein
VFNEMTLTVIQLLPMRHILAQINLLGRPEDGHVLLVFGPNIVVANGEDHKALLIRV